jgi:hypothetical protein
MKPRDYCCCAIPLINVGIYTTLIEQLVLGILVGTLSVATPRSTFWYPATHLGSSIDSVSSRRSCSPCRRPMDISHHLLRWRRIASDGHHRSRQGLSSYTSSPRPRRHRIFFTGKAHPVPPLYHAAWNNHCRGVLCVRCVDHRLGDTTHDRRQEMRERLLPLQRRWDRSGGADPVRHLPVGRRRVDVRALGPSGNHAGKTLSHCKP